MNRDVPVSLRPAAPADIDFLVPAVHESTSGLTAAIFGDAKLRARLLRLSSVVGISAFTVAICGNEPVGHYSGYDIDAADAEQPVGVLPEEVEPLVRPLRVMRPRGSWYLSTLWVREMDRRAGIGELLLRSAFQKAHQADRRTISLHVFSGNAPALRLYERHGFAVRSSSAMPFHPSMTPNGDLLLLTADVAEIE